MHLICQLIVSLSGLIHTRKEVVSKKEKKKKLVYGLGWLSWLPVVLLLVAALSEVWYNLALSSGGISKNCCNAFFFS